VPVRLGPRSYTVRVAPRGDRLLANWLLRRRDPWVVVTDAGVRRHVWPRLALALRDAGLAVPEPIVVPAGEPSKSLRTLQRLQAEMLRRELDRTTCVVALGGGVVGDLAGFAAATYLRGVDWIAVPTTLLAMVDASIGGKVGVNVLGTKNASGAFHQPRAVLVGTEFLRTLPQRERASGLAEVVKYAMIADRRLFGVLERGAAAWRRSRPAADARLVARCCRIKVRFVESDERESGLRAALNFGHTLGHALEGDGRRGLRHGEAVGLGMRVACALGEALGVAREPQQDRLAALLRVLGLPLHAPRTIPAATLRGAWRRDKKARGGTPRLVLTPQIGAVSVDYRVPEDLILQALHVIGVPRPDSISSRH